MSEVRRFLSLLNLSALREFLRLYAAVFALNFLIRLIKARRSNSAQVFSSASNETHAEIPNIVVEKNSNNVIITHETWKKLPEIKLLSAQNLTSQLESLDFSAVSTQHFAQIQNPGTVAVITTSVASVQWFHGQSDSTAFFASQSPIDRQLIKRQLHEVLLSRTEELLEALKEVPAHEPVDFAAVFRDLAVSILHGLLLNKTVSEESADESFEDLVEIISRLEKENLESQEKMINSLNATWNSSSILSNLTSGAMNIGNKLLMYDEGTVNASDAIRKYIADYSSSDKNENIIHLSLFNVERLKLFLSEVVRSIQSILLNLLVELSLNADFQRKLVDYVDECFKGRFPELEEVFMQTDDNASDPVLKNLLGFLSASIAETMRLHENKVIVKVVAEEKSFHDDILFPLGSQVVFSSTAVTFNGKLFPNVSKFDPERWILTGLSSRKDDIEKKILTMAFGKANGDVEIIRDICIQTVRFMIIILLQRYTFKFPDAPVENDTEEEGRIKVWLLPQKRVMRLRSMLTTP